ncbi:MAG: S8 family serine peptidase [Phycisphaerales bacterium]|nr:S8 family serine peptidase [Phycisphaerales bacterium]
MPVHGFFNIHGGKAPRVARSVATAWIAIHFWIVVPGCGTVSPPPDGETEAVDAPDPVADVAGADVFVEDADPEVARLPFAQNELLARVFPGSAADDLAAAYQDAGVTPVADLSPIQMVAVTVEGGGLLEAAATLAASPVIESVHKSYQYDAQRTPDDPEFSAQDHLSQLGMVDAWSLTTGDSSRVIAILDTGVEPSHPDLIDKLVPGWNMYDDDNDTGDVLGHGTGVAGSAAAASDNGVGIAGIAWDNPIMPIRISSSEGRASSRHIAQGVIWAVNHGARIINVSFAPLGSDATVLAAAQFARNSGALVFISAGNSGKLLQAVDNDNAVFVGALDEQDALAAFSDTGAFVDLTAPGTRIRTTATDGAYRPVNGTSFASPIVAGVAALVWSANSSLRPTTVYDILIDTAVDLGDRGRDVRFGHGAVDPVAAIEAAQATTETADTRAPTVTIIQPRDNDAVRGQVRVEIGAHDVVGVADVVLLVDGVPFATDTTSPYTFSFATDDYSTGVHTVSVVAADGSGNASPPQSVRVRINGGSGSTTGGGGGTGDPGTAQADSIAPTIIINAPVDNSIVRTSVAVQATITDNAGLRRLEWLVDDVRTRVDTVSGTRQVRSFVWDASAAPAGPHRIGVRVEDSSRNVTIASVTVNKE